MRCSEKSDKGDQTILRIFIPMRRKRLIGACASAPPLRTLETKQNTRVQGRSPGKILYLYLTQTPFPCIWGLLVYILNKKVEIMHIVNLVGWVSRTGFPCIYSGLLVQSQQTCMWWGKEDWWKENLPGWRPNQTSMVWRQRLSVKWMTCVSITSTLVWVEYVVYIVSGLFSLRDDLTMKAT